MNTPSTNRKAARDEVSTARVHSVGASAALLLRAGLVAGLVAGSSGCASTPGARPEGEGTSQASRAEGDTGPVPEAASGSFAVVGARVFDGERVHPATTVLVREGRIAAIGAHVEIPAGVPTVSGRGKTLLPGLIDAHSHVGVPGALAQSLAFGVTTVLDMFTPPQVIAGQKARLDQPGGEAMADLRSSGILVTAKGGHGTEYGIEIPTLDRPEDAEAFVEARISEGADYIKLVYDDYTAYGMRMPTLSKEGLEAAIEAAHARELLAVVHVGSLSEARDAIELGADGLVHVWADAPRDDASDGGASREAELKAVAQLAADREVFIIPTLGVLHGLTGVPVGRALAQDAKLSPYLHPELAASLERAMPFRFEDRFESLLASVKLLDEAGVALLAGTDALNPGVTYGASLHQELELLVRAGLPPREALVSATSAPAKAFGLDDRGRIAPGMRADLVLVDGAPDVTIDATRSIAAIWKAGERFDREAWRASVRAAGSEGAAPAASETDATFAGQGTVLLADFERGSLLQSEVGAGWTPSTDGLFGGRSTVSLEELRPGAGGSRRALRVEGEIQRGPAPWAGAMLAPGPVPFGPVDLSAKQGVRFMARGEGGTARVMLFTSATGNRPLTVELTPGEAWERFELPLEAFGTDGQGVLGILFASGTQPGPFFLELDDVELY